MPNLRNFLEELSDELVSHGKKAVSAERDISRGVRWVGSVGKRGSRRVSWDKFVEVAKEIGNVHSDNVNKSLVVVGYGWWLERYIPSCSCCPHFWDYKEIPKRAEFCPDEDNFSIRDIVKYKAASGIERRRKLASNDPSRIIRMSGDHGRPESRHQDNPEADK